MLTKIRQNLSIFTLAISTCGTNWCAAQPRYAEMTDTVFQVGDLIRHDFFPSYVLRPNPMKFPNDNCINTSDEIYLFFLELVNFIQSQPKLVLEISSHTDWRGSAASNLDLSQRRANSIVDCMIREHSIDSSQVRAKGYGRSEPRTIYLCEEEYYPYPDLVPDTCIQICDAVTLTNEYIEQFKANKVLFERLHQFNRRVDVKVVGIREIE